MNSFVNDLLVIVPLAVIAIFLWRKRQPLTADRPKRSVLVALSTPLLLACGLISWLPVWLGAGTQTCDGCQAEAAYFVLGPFLYAGIAIVPFIVTYLIGETLRRKGKIRAASVCDTIRIIIPLLSLLLLYVAGLLLI